MKKLIIIACLLCSCATISNGLSAKEEHIVRNVAFLASFDVVCFVEEIVVRKVSANLYEARCIHNDRKAYYSTVGSEIKRVK